MKDDAHKVHEKSFLARAQENKEQKAFFFDVSGIFGLGNKPIERIAIVRGTGRDFEAAVLSAHKYAAEQIRQYPGAEAASKDFDFMGDAKLRQILFRLCRAVDPQDPNSLQTTKDGKSNYPAFPSPDWIRDNLHTDQIAALMNLVGEVRARLKPRPEGMDPDCDPLGIDVESVDRIVNLLSENLSTDLPERILAPVDREFLTHTLVLVCDQLKDSRLAVDQLQKEREELQARVAELEVALSSSPADGDVGDIAPSGSETPSS